jgi:hypothetical protein
MSFVGIQVPAEPTPERVEATALWEKVIAAKGGRERLYKVANIVQSSRLTSKGSPEMSQALYVFPNRAWIWQDAGRHFGGANVSIYDFDNMLVRFRWANETFARHWVPKLVERKPLDDVQAIDLLETPWMHLRPVRAWSAKRGRDPMFIECKFTYADVPADVVFALDPRTLLPQRSVITFPALALDKTLQKSLEFLDYTDIDGIKMPTRIRHMEPIKFEEKVEYQFNVAYRADLFDTTPETEKGADGWRK